MPHGTLWKFPLLVVPSHSSSFFFFFWSEPTSQTIRDWIILAAGLCFHIRAPWKGLITIWSIVQFPSISPRTLRSVQRERRAATNGVWTIINSSSSFIVFISFEVEISSLYLCFIYSFFYFSFFPLFCLNCHSELHPLHRGPANVSGKGLSGSGSLEHPHIAASLRLTHTSTQG